jgi:hypothetical protein
MPNSVDWLTVPARDGFEPAYTTELLDCDSLTLVMVTPRATWCKQTFWKRRIENSSNLHDGVTLVKWGGR